MARVLICDKLETQGVDLLTKAGFELDLRSGLRPRKHRNSCGMIASSAEAIRFSIPHPQAPLPIFGASNQKVR